MTWDLVEEFQFNSDAKDVCISILNNKSMRQIKITEDWTEFTANLSAELSGRVQGALYSIKIYVYIKEFTWSDDFAEWLVMGKRVGEIVITQNQQGKCVAKLYCEADPLKWCQFENCPVTNWPVIVGVHFFSLMWVGLINECLELNNSAKLADVEKDVGRKRKHRVDVKKRVALALYRHEKDTLSIREAADRAKTSTQSISKYKDLPEVQKILEKFKSNPRDASYYQSQLNRKNQGKRGNKVS